MSVLVIGDSFADPKTWNYEDNPHAWMNILSNTSDIKVTFSASIERRARSHEYGS